MNEVKHALARSRARSVFRGTTTLTGNVKKKKRILIRSGEAVYESEGDDNGDENRDREAQGKAKAKAEGENRGREKNTECRI